MEFWPSASPNQSKSSTHKSRDVQIPQESYPNVETGRLAAVSLAERENGRFYWSYASRTASSGINASSTWRKVITDDNTANRIRSKGPVTAFPATRIPASVVPHSSIQQKAEQSANFLRTFLPEVDVTADLMREELTADEQLMRSLKKFDPLDGNVLTSISDEGHRYLAFPIGDVGCDLNISPISADENIGTFKPQSQAIHSFSTPIRQLVSSSPLARSNKNSLLAVRTFGPTHLTELRHDSAGTVEVVDVASFDRKETGNRPISDVNFLAQSSNIVAANDSGGVYQFDVGQVTSIAGVVETGETADDHFWRVTASSHPQSCFLTSGKTVRECDFRAAEKSSLILEVPHGIEENYTCLEKPLREHLLPLCSTNRIIWLDRRSPGKPLLGYRHRRQYDRTLQTLSLDDTRTLLLSRKNGLVTACNVLLDELAHQDGHPYVLTSGSRDTFAGHTFLPRNGDDGSFFRVMEDGGLVRYDLNWGDGDEIQSQGLNWSDDILALRDSSTSRKPNHGPLGGREFSQVNLRPVYEHLFSDLEAEVEDLDEVLDSLSTYWQRTEAPVDYVLTTHDIIRSCGDEPERPSRSNFLAPNSLISTDGYRALLGGRFPWETLRQNSQWHRGIGDTLSNVPTHRNDDIQSLNDSLTSPDVFEDEDTDARIRRRQEKAREGLSLDLILSKDIYCHRPVPSLTPALETMAGALSLSEEPPSVAFSFLQPMHSGDHYSKEEEKDEQVEMPLGVRLLLKEWEIGTDPNDAVFTDPYGEQEPPNILRKKSAFSPPPIEPVPFEVQPQAPPMVLASSTLAPTPVTKTLPQTFSQPIDNLPVPSEGETQGMFASTQVLPGPFGARPKKKPGKKRLGGF